MFHSDWRDIRLTLRCMRILAVSDVEDEAVTASLPERAGSIDLVLGCGDLTY